VDALRVVLNTPVAIAPGAPIAALQLDFDTFSPAISGTVTNTITAVDVPGLNAFSTLVVTPSVEGYEETTTLSATAAITLSKTADPDLRSPGDVVTYTITVTNSGNGIADVSLVDTLAGVFNPTFVPPALDFTIGTSPSVKTISFSAIVGDATAQTDVFTADFEPPAATTVSRPTQAAASTATGCRRPTR
jgi:uncharacterized repeat protein (TIGR01451 family)